MDSFYKVKYKYSKYKSRPENGLHMWVLQISSVMRAEWLRASKDCPASGYLSISKRHVCVLTRAGSKSCLTVKLSTTQEARLCSTQARNTITTANMWKSILGKSPARYNPVHLNPTTTPWWRKPSIFSWSASYLECRMKRQQALCLSWEDVWLFYSWRTDYFHILNLNAEFKSTANPVNKIPRCKLMKGSVQGSVFWARRIHEDLQWSQVQIWRFVETCSKSGDTGWLKVSMKPSSLWSIFT